MDLGMLSQGHTLTISAAVLTGSVGPTELLLLRLGILRAEAQQDTSLCKDIMMCSDCHACSSSTTAKVLFWACTTAAAVFQLIPFRAAHI